MNPSSKLSRLALPSAVIVVLAAVAGTALVGMAFAKSFALTVAKGATVTNAVTHAGVRENIAVNGKRHAVYTLSGDTTKHLKCTAANGCFKFWPPLTTTSKKPALAPGISGKLGEFRRDGFTQLTLNGQPLYTFSEDTHAANANGQDFVGFGGTWHVIKTAGASTPISMTTTTTSPTSTVPGYTSPTTTTTTTTSTTSTYTIPYY